MKVKTLTLAELARELGITPQALIPLVEAGYFYAFTPQDPFEETVISLPPGPLLTWVKMMLLPMHERPLFKLDEVARMTGMSVKDLRRFISPLRVRMKGKQFMGFGWLLSITEVRTIVEALPEVERRFDRVALLQVLTGRRLGQEMRHGTVPFNRYLDEEISRVSRLPEPQKTIRATLLWESLSDAKSVAECFRSYKERMKYFPIEKQMERAERLAAKVARLKLMLKEAIKEEEEEKERGRERDKNKLNVEPVNHPRDLPLDMDGGAAIAINSENVPETDRVPIDNLPLDDVLDQNLAKVVLGGDGEEIAFHKLS